MKVKVAEFRSSIDAAMNSLNVHWASCVSEQERISWFVSAFKRFSELRTMECPTAKEADVLARENAFDRFASHCETHHAIWMKARAYVKLIKQGEDSQNAFKTLKVTSAYQIIASQTIH